MAPPERCFLWIRRGPWRCTQVQPTPYTVQGVSDTVSVTPCHVAYAT